MLEDKVDDQHPGGYRSLRVSDPNEMVYFYARSYWLTRDIQETHPELLKSLFNKRYRHKELETRLAAAYHMSRQEFWRTANQRTISHFKERSSDAAD